jgi:hypothetical protein
MYFNIASNQAPVLATTSAGANNTSVVAHDIATIPWNTSTISPA